MITSCVTCPFEGFSLPTVPYWPELGDTNHTVPPLTAMASVTGLPIVHEPVTARVAVEIRVMTPGGGERDVDAPAVDGQTRRDELVRHGGDEHARRVVDHDDVGRRDEHPHPSRDPPPCPGTCQAA